MECCHVGAIFLAHAAEHLGCWTEGPRPIGAADALKNLPA